MDLQDTINSHKQGPEYCVYISKQQRRCWPVGFLSVEKQRISVNTNWRVDSKWFYGLVQHSVSWLWLFLCSWGKLVVLVALSKLNKERSKIQYHKSTVTVNTAVNSMWPSFPRDPLPSHLNQSHPVKILADNLNHAYLLFIFIFIFFIIIFLILHNGQTERNTEHAIGNILAE